MDWITLSDSEEAQNFTPTSSLNLRSRDYLHSVKLRFTQFLLRFSYNSSHRRSSALVVHKFHLTVANSIYVPITKPTENLNILTPQDPRSNQTPQSPPKSINTASLNLSTFKFKVYVEEVKTADKQTCPHNRHDFPRCSPIAYGYSNEHRNDAQDSRQG